MNRKYRKTVIAGNWKMNKTPSETKEFMTQLKAIMPDPTWISGGSKPPPYGTLPHLTVKITSPPSGSDVHIVRRNNYEQKVS